jgi:PAS domain S-box-containing protein
MIHRPETKDTPNQPVGHGKAWHLPIAFEPGFRNDHLQDPFAISTFTKTFEFQELLIEILSGFIHLPSTEVDRAMQFALHRLCSFLGVERAGLWRAREESFVLTHHCSDSRHPADKGLGTQAQAPGTRANLDGLGVGADLTLCYPWLSAQAKLGKACLFSRIAELPDEAAQDKEALARTGTRSGAFIPLVAGGSSLGAISFEMCTQDKVWSEPLLRWLEMVAEVFAEASARKVSDEKLLASEALLTMAAASAEAALWSLDLRTRRFQATSKAYELIGLQPGSELSFEQFLQVVHPDDRERVRDGTEATVRSQGEIDIEFRVVLAKGDTYWVSSRGRCQYSSTGIPERLLGVAADITERKHAESRLRESETRFKTVADSAPVLIWMSGTDGLCNFFNKTWVNFTGRAAEQEMGNGWVEGVHPEDREECIRVYSAAFDARQPFALHYRLRRHDGQYRWLLDHGVPRFDAQRKFEGYIGSCIDVTERKTAEQALVDSYSEIKLLKDRLQAETDYLRAEIKVTQAHGTIIGRSEAIRGVLHQAEQVAAANCPVLISGATGTGKELIAQQIHRLSARKGPHHGAGELCSAPFRSGGK